MGDSKKTGKIVGVAVVLVVCAFFVWWKMYHVNPIRGKTMGKRPYIVQNAVKRNAIRSTLRK